MSEQQNEQPETKTIKKVMTIEEVKRAVKSCAIASGDPKEVLKRFGKTLTEWRDTKKPSKELTDRMHSQAAQALQTVALETHYLAAEVVGENYRTFVIDLTNQLIEEYQCGTASEKTIAENIAISYGRVLELSRATTSMARQEYTTHEKNVYYSVLSKELDRAQRQFTSSLLVLKQMKSPTLEVNIKAGTAFIAQNQQVNAVPQNGTVGKPPTDYEINDPK